MNHFVIPFIYKIEKMYRMNKMNYIVPHLYSEKDKMNEMNHFFPHLYCEKRQNEQNELHCPPPLF